MKLNLKKIVALTSLVLVSFALVACGSKLTNENLTKVKNGMSEVEVKAILGKPDKVDSSEILGLRNVSYQYTSGKTEVSITFINDSVISKSGNFQ
jgi:hypothetical protein